MRNKWYRRQLSLISLVMALFTSASASAQDRNLVVRIAKLQIDSAQLENYKAALKEHAETAVRVRTWSANTICRV